MKKISGILSLFVSIPIWFYLLYQILVRVGATELMMFLFWIYVPVSIFSSMLAKLVESK
jgi:hypothetical protein